MSDLTARFIVGTRDAFRLGVDLTVPHGTTVALLGPNGAGKSTAVRAIAGLDAIESGVIALGATVFDAPDDGVFVPSAQRGVGVVFQDRLLFAHLNVLDNVTFGLTSRGVDRGEAEVRARAWLDRLGIGGVERQSPAELSGGQAQRVALARALVTEPDLLLLDEPLSSLDVTARIELRHVLAEHLAAFDGPRLLITHDPTEAFLLADDVHILERGVITQHGTADDIRLHPLTPFAADLAGLNLVRGVLRDGRVDAAGHTLHVATNALEGPVLVTIHPTAISVHARRPGGSPRNVWETIVERVEPLGSRARLRTGGPLPLTVEVTEASRRELDLSPGTGVWIAVKATEIGVRSDAS